MSSEFGGTLASGNRKIWTVGPQPVLHGNKYAPQHASCLCPTRGFRSTTVSLAFSRRACLMNMLTNFLRQLFSGYASTTAFTP